MSLIRTIDIAVDFDKNILSQPLVFIDIETRGGKKASDAIIEIAVVRVAPGEKVRGFASLVRSDDAGTFQKTHQITNYHLAFAPTFQQILPLLKELCDNAMMVAQNAAFEHRHLKSMFTRLGGDWELPNLCTIKLAKRVFPQQKKNGGYSLAKLIQLLSF